MVENVLIANKNARWGLSRKKIRRVLTFFRANGMAFSFVRTQHPDHARQLAAEAAAGGVRTIIVVGGDGTINEVVNSVVSTDCCEAPRIAIVPTGSSNDFSKSLNIPQQPEAACRRILRGETRELDVGLAGTHHFIMASTIGLLATIAQESTKLTGLSGARRYITAALKVIARMPAPWQMTIESDSDSFAGPYSGLLVSNVSRFGGLPFAPGARPDDGLLDCLLVGPVSKAQAIRLVPWVLRGALARHPKITAFRTKSLRVRLDRPAPVNNDGEVRQQQFDRLDYQLLRRRLQFIC